MIAHLVPKHENNNNQSHKFDKAYIVFAVQMLIATLLSKLLAVLVVASEACEAVAEHSKMPEQEMSANRAVTDFRRKNMLKDSWIPKVQSIPRGASSFRIGQETIRLDDLVPLEGLFARDIEIFVDGVRESPKVFVYQSVQSPKVHVVLDENKKVLKASSLLSNGHLLDLDCLEGDVYTEVDPSSDLDESLHQGIDVVSIVVWRCSCTYFLPVVSHKMPTHREAWNHRSY